MKKTVIALALIASTSAFADVKGGKFGMGFSYAGSWGATLTTANTGVSSAPGNASSPINASMPTLNAQYHITDLIASRRQIWDFTRQITRTSLL